MSAIHRLREKAQSAGALPSNAQQSVEVQQVEGTKVIVIRPTRPDVIHVPSYNPVVVFGAAPVYAPYPEMADRSVSTGAIVAGSAISFGVGIAMGAYFSGWRGGWGWGCSRDLVRPCTSITHSSTTTASTGGLMWAAQKPRLGRTTLISAAPPRTRVPRWPAGMEPVVRWSQVCERRGAQRERSPV